METEGREHGPRPLEEPASVGDRRLDGVARLLAVIDRLRAPSDGCPWDLEQTVESLAPGLIEEAFESVEAIEAGKDGAVVEELGDLLMGIGLIARIASEEGRFDLGDIGDAVTEKLVRRHPHVFGETRVSGTGEVLANWEKIKRNEREDAETDASALAGVPKALPALQRADRIGAKAISAGFRWSDARGALAKLEEEVAELEAEMERGDRDAIERELGDVLMAGALLGRYLGVDPEGATRAAVRRFEARFRAMEARLDAGFEGLDEAALLQAWEAAKERST
ncbi:MAG TPA: nucleoside triphosphate pyrophosphohydrolase [Planctomycetes bacterium]|nr:nucleoside triphosphate pyrophosphohydrolase [Planctomycetota bacterium]